MAVTKPVEAFVFESCDDGTNWIDWILSTELVSGLLSSLGDRHKSVWVEQGEPVNGRVAFVDSTDRKSTVWYDPTTDRWCLGLYNGQGAVHRYIPATDSALPPDSNDWRYKRKDAPAPGFRIKFLPEYLAAHAAAEGLSAPPEISDEKSTPAAAGEPESTPTSEPDQEAQPHVEQQAHQPDSAPGMAPN